MRTPDSSSPSRFELPTVPAWAVPRGQLANPAEAAFMAGAALNSLDNLVHSEPIWAGAWRQRLALKSAAQAVALTGRVEDERALRDAWHLRAAGADPGPAGKLLAAWTQLAERAPRAATEGLRAIGGLLGLSWSAELGPLQERLDELLRSAMPAPFVAAAILGEVARSRPDAELLGWWLADHALARRMRWPAGLPLLVAQARGPAFREAGARGLIRPGDAAFERAVCAAVALAADEACRLAGEIAPGAARLVAVTPKLRAKGAGDAIRLLLEQDAVPGTLQTGKLTRWGSRRLFERLMAFDAVRELSGRASFRLYGL